MSAGTVVICGGILATVILLTIVAVLCYCRLQYYCCKREEPGAKEAEEEPEISTMSPSRPLAPPVPPVPPTPERYSDYNEAAGYDDDDDGDGDDDDCPPTFLTESNGPAAGGYSPPPTRGGPLQRSHAFCPSCARYSLPFYLQHPERLCNGGRRVGYRTVQQQEVDLPTDNMASFYQQKLNLIRSVTMREVVTHSVSTDV